LKRSNLFLFFAVAASFLAVWGLRVYVFYSNTQSANICQPNGTCLPQPIAVQIWQNTADLGLTVCIIATICAVILWVIRLRFVYLT